MLLNNYSGLEVGSQEAEEESIQRADIEVKERFEGRKLQNMLLVESYRRLSENFFLEEEVRDKFKTKVKRVGECGNVLTFTVEKERNKVKLVKAMFCKDRLCVMCNWRRSLKLFSQVSKVIDYLQEKGLVVKDKQGGEQKRDIEYIFITLTVRNCGKDELNDTIGTLIKAFRDLSRKTRFKKAFLGYFRSLEITRNRDLIEQDMEFHPHIHALLAVDKARYFDGKAGLYVSTFDLRNMWADCLDIPKDSQYRKDLQVDMKKVKLTGEVEANDEVAKGKAVREVSKYIAKPTAYTKGNWADNDETVLNLTNSLFRRNLVGFGGIFADVRKKLKLDDAEKGDLVNYSGDEELRLDVAKLFIYYRFNGAEYVRS